MRLYNKSERTYQHSYFDNKNQLVVLNLYPKTNNEIPDDIAKLWLATGEVVEYVDPQEAKAKQEKAAKKQAELETENEKLKAELEKQKEFQDENAKLKAEIETLKNAATLEALKKEADALGVEYPANIGIAKLQERINTKKNG